MKCPYCNEEINTDDTTMHDSGYDYTDGSYYIEYRITCENCDNEIRYFRNFVEIKDSVMQMDE